MLDQTNTPAIQPSWQITATSTSTVVANDVLYHIASCTGGKCLFARDPATGTVLWTSQTLGGSIKWQSPIIIDGAVYVAAGTSLNRFDLGGGGATHTVTPTAGPNGSIAPSTPQTVQDGATTAFTVTPNAHYRIASVVGCGGSLNGNLYTTGPITADCTVTATFAPDTSDVIFRSGFDGTTP